MIWIDMSFSFRLNAGNKFDPFLAMKTETVVFGAVVQRTETTCAPEREMRPGAPRPDRQFSGGSFS